MNSFQIGDWNPALSNQTFLSHIQIKEIQRVVDGLDFTNFGEPHFYILGSRNQNTVSVILRLI